MPLRYVRHRAALNPISISPRYRPLVPVVCARPIWFLRYMANHGVTSMAQVEDMKVVLEAYWAVASKRIAENICMVFETHLLNDGR